MKIVSQIECHEWLREKLRKDFAWHVVEHHYAYGLTYQMPVDTGKKTALARLLSAGIDATETGLLWITGWGIFPSSENMALFDRYRESMGERRSIGTAPGHLFGKSDVVAIECLLDLSLYFYWDTSLFDARGIWIKTSHDEYVSVNAIDAVRLKDFEDSLSRLKLTRLARKE